MIKFKIHDGMMFFKFQKLTKNYYSTCMMNRGLFYVIIAGQNLTGVVGSPAYVAPEVLVGNYSEKIDIWSAGVLLHGLLVGTLPFKGDSLESVFEAIKKEKLDFSDGVWESVSKPARDLLSGMLMRSTSMRFTANEVLSKLPLFFSLCLDLA